LVARLETKVTDRRLIALIQRMLKAKVVMPDGVVVSTEEGVPQGGPLSPLLSNIVLDELDRELARRGYRFVRYADDANIYVRSERAGYRVMASVVRFIERQLRLKVNQAKSAVARPEERHFVGFSFRRNPEDGSVEVFLSTRSKVRIDARIRELTPRAWGQSLRGCMATLNPYLRGWLNFFGTSCTDAVVRTLHTLDAHIRRRLRAVLLRQWKRRRFIVRRLIRMGARPNTAWRVVYEGRKALWALSHCGPVDYALDKRYFADQELFSLEHRYREMHRVIAPAQLTLALE
jgi:group II intron reverse transcriptase/maturase